MAENLYPEGYEDEVVTEEDLILAQAAGYRNGIAFDSRRGDFLRDGMNKLMDSDGIESWKSWCINCIQTERYAYLAYSTDYGVEIEKAMKASNREEAESILTRQITEAIMADPYQRARYVGNITYDWIAPDSVEANIIIHGIDDVTIDITAYITKGADYSNIIEPDTGNPDVTIFPNGDEVRY